MQIGIYVDPSNYYEAAAERWSKDFGCSFDGVVSFMLLQAAYSIPNETLDEIELDFTAFSERVNDYLYGLA